MPQEPSDPEVSSIEEALGQLRPARSRLDRDLLMFQAGAFSARSAAKRRWVWPSIAAALGFVALSESIVLSARPGASVVVVQVPAPEEKSTSPVQVQILSQSAPSQSPVPDPWSPGDSQTLGLRRQVLRFGLEGLPAPRPLLTQLRGSAAALGSDDSPPGPLRRYELNKVLDLGGPS
jgi:hypothetical protein